MECFSIDESGYTGFDLLNKDQPFQGAAAISIDDAESIHLINEHFPKLQATELKYSSLSRRPSNSARLINLQRDLLANYKCTTYICNKKYLLILFFLDHAVEPFYSARNVDFYKNGSNYALGSILFHMGNRLFGERFYIFLEKFQKSIKEKSDESITDLIQEARNLEWQNLPEAMGPLVHADQECISSIQTAGVSTDAAFVVLQSLISRLEIISSDKYRIEHDTSKNLLQYSTLIERLIRHTDNIEFRQSEIATIKFPLKLSSVQQVDSKHSLGVQLADILIGSAIDASNSLVGIREKDIYTEEIFSLYSDNQIIHLLPDLDIKKSMEFRHGTQANQVIDYFGKHFYS